MPYGMMSPEDMVKEMKHTKIIEAIFQIMEQSGISFEQIRQEHARRCGYFRVVLSTISHGAHRDVALLIKDITKSDLIDEEKLFNMELPHTIQIRAIPENEHKYLTEAFKKVGAIIYFDRIW